VDKLTKKEIRGPDGFHVVAEKIWTTTKPFHRLLMIASGLLLLFGLGSAGYSYFKELQEKKATEELALALFEYDKEEGAWQKKQLGKAEIKPEDVAEEFKKSPDLFAKVIQNHSGSVAAAQAALYLGRIYSDLKQYDKATQILSTHVKSSTGLVQALIVNQLANIQAASGKCIEAVDRWKSLLSDKNASFLHPEAHLKTGECFEVLNDTGKAKENYEAVIKANVGSEYTEKAKLFLRLMSLKADRSTAGKP